MNGCVIPLEDATNQENNGFVLADASGMVPGGNATIMQISYTSGPASQQLFRRSHRPSVVARVDQQMSVGWHAGHAWHPITQENNAQQLAYGSSGCFKQLNTNLHAYVPGWRQLCIHAYKWGPVQLYPAAWWGDVSCCSIMRVVSGILAK